MIDFKYLTSDMNVDRQTFYSTSGLTWQTWTKPKGRSMAYMLIIGGGGGGGTGTQFFGFVNTQGGAGGGAGGITSLLVPFFLIPDTLYIQPGTFGTGGPFENGGSASGQPGAASYVSVYPNTNANNVLAQANGGGAGFAVTTTPGVGGAPILATSTTKPRYFSLCNVTSYAGQDGGGGSNTGNNSSRTFTSPWSSLVINSIATGGAGGGGGGDGYEFGAAGGYGGSIIGGDDLSTFLKDVNGGPAAAGAGGAGGDGYFNLKPWLSVGGAGSGGQVNYVSGGAIAGKANGYGSGGGGAGPGSANDGAAIGGDGAPGIVIIISY